MNKIKFSEEAWLAAGFRALTTDGPTAIKAEVLARNLGASKGSFYWNFSDLPSFKLAMLGLWRDGVIQEIEGHILTEPDKLKRLELLVTHAGTAAPEEYGGRRVEPAMRSWALTDPSVLAVVNEVDKMRLSFVAKLLGDIGKSDPALAHLVYGAFIGLDDLASKGRAEIGESLELLLRMVKDL